MIPNNLQSTYFQKAITAVNNKIKNVTPSFIGITHNVIDWIKP